MKTLLCLLLCLLLTAFPALAEGEPTDAAPETQSTRTPGELRSGDEGEAVAAVQEKLIAMGFLSGEADGRFGKKTEAAVKLLQEYLAGKGVETRTDGVWEAALEKYLEDTKLFAQWFVLRKGDKGPLVEKLQARLIELGFLLGRADGTFGAATQTALVRFQQALYDQGVAEMKPDGVAGPITQKWLYESDLSGYAIVTPAMYDEDDPLGLRAGHLYCSACILIDCDSGTVLFAKNPQEKVYPASTTKIMTLLLALERVDLRQNVTIPACAEDVPKDSSRVPIYEGEEMTWKDLLHGLMIRSGNDAANAAAYLIAGSVEGFVDLMNRKAEELGMTGTHFANPHGYHDAQHYTTALDMARLTRKAMQNEDFREIVSCREYVMAATSRRWILRIKNNYAILDPEANEYYPYAFGVKTGYTNAAGRCYVGAAEKDGHTLVCAVFNSGNAASHKFIDAARLFQFGFAALDGQ